MFTVQKKTNQTSSVEDFFTASYPVSCSFYTNLLFLTLVHRPLRAYGVKVRGLGLSVKTRMG